MAEYIEREAAKQALLAFAFECENMNVNPEIVRGIRYAREELNTVPAADVVAVVRCKDCKHFGKDMGQGKHDCKKYEMPYCLENDFCSYGEREG